MLRGLVFALSLAVLFLHGASAQPPRPSPPPPPPPIRAHDIRQRIRDIRARLESSRPAGTEQHELATFAKRYLEQAEQAARSHHLFVADRLADAADACRRPLDHFTDLELGHGPVPPRDVESSHLRQVYFRLQLSDFFMKQLPEPKPQRLLELAREFYEQALEATQAGQIARADTYATSADDLTHALESLAQACAPAAPAPPPPAPQ